MYEPVTLAPIDHDTMYASVPWRLSCRESLRTARILTVNDQVEFFSKQPSNARYFALKVESSHIPIGIGGLHPIEWENRQAEISLLIDPTYRKHGYGKSAVKALLHEAFTVLNLHHVIGEVYYCSPALPFWQKIVEEYRADTRELPSRKFWNGSYHPSLYFVLYQAHYLTLLKKEQSNA